MSHRADILFHIDEDIADDQALNIEKDVAFTSGVYSACVNPKSNHLMIVDYDPDTVSSQTLLREVQAHGVHAEMVGF